VVHLLPLCARCEDLHTYEVDNEGRERALGLSSWQEEEYPLRIHREFIGNSSGIHRGVVLMHPCTRIRALREKGNPAAEGGRAASNGCLMIGEAQRGGGIRRKQTC
jgi:hypothetical protein